MNPGWWLLAGTWGALALAALRVAWCRRPPVPPADEPDTVEIPAVVHEDQAIALTHPIGRYVPGRPMTDWEDAQWRWITSALAAITHLGDDR